MADCIQQHVRPVHTRVQPVRGFRSGTIPSERPYVDKQTRPKVSVDCFRPRHHHSKIRANILCRTNLNSAYPEPNKYGMIRTIRHEMRTGSNKKKHD